MFLFLFFIWIQMQFQKVSAVNCGAILTNSSGWFSSPDTDSDGEYEFNADCTWIITVPNNKVIHIHFLEFDVEEGVKCSYDYLRIRDGNTKVGHYCGDTLPPDFISTSRLVFIDFYSDQFINKKGFNATYTELDDPTCGYRTWSVAGKFGSFDTNLDIDCTWTVAEQKHVPAIQVYIAKLDTGVGNQTVNCEDFFLEIYSDTATLGRICQDEIPTIIMTLSHVLHLHLHSSEEADFHVYFCTTDVNATFGGILTDTSGSFTATDYDGNGLYDNNVNTIWTMVAKDGYSIRLHVYDIHIHSGFDSCAGDTLKIYDGVFEVGTEIVEICGYNVEDRTVKSQSEVLFAHFLTNAYYSGLGFNATYVQVKNFGKLTDNRTTDVSTTKLQAVTTIPINTSLKSQTTTTTNATLKSQSTTTIKAATTKPASSTITSTEQTSDASSSKTSGVFIGVMIDVLFVLVY